VRSLLILAFILSTSSGCAYRFGLSDRALPGGYTEVAVPVFKNKTQDVGIEMYFTNALIRRFARSQVARVTSKEDSPVTLEGTIRQIDTVPGPGLTNADSQLHTLPDNAVLTSDYRMVVAVDMVLKRKSDDKILWRGTFNNERVYQAALIGGQVSNSADPLYDHNARMQTLSLLAEDMMQEAHDRITENF
jgi:hypothetical protein